MISNQTQNRKAPLGKHTSLTRLSTLKNSKTPGPDDIQGELKGLNAANGYPDTQYIPRVVKLGEYSFVFFLKKGDPAKLDNYRPIALLQVFYKILAALVKNRLMDIKYGGKERHEHFAHSLDWEKAFNKVHQRKTVEVLRRLNVPETMTQIIQNIYQNAQFRVVKGENKSEYYRQNSGCPLSPYLFTIVMSANFQDIKHRLNTPRQKEPIPGITFAEILYADDTFLFDTLNRLLHQIQAESQKYNMKVTHE